MKHLIGKVITKEVDFMQDKVEIRKLSVAEVMKVQVIVTKASKTKSETAQLGLLRDVIRIAVVGAEEISDLEFDSFPIGELNDLTTSILVYSGLQGEEVGN